MDESIHTIGANSRMKIKDIITDVPITDYERLGDFKKPGSFNDPRDKKLIQNPKHEQKLIKFFQNTHEDFRIFPVNLPGLRRYSQTGMVTPAFIQQVFAKHPDIANKILSDYENAITIVYVSNTGDEKVVFTPWIMAHRFGHAINARTDIRTWELAEGYFFNDVNSNLSDIYNLPERRGGFDRQLSSIYNALFNAIGSQRSSRQGLINRPYEMLYEIFAQYLQNGGSIKLNPFPRVLQYGKPTYGRKSKLVAPAEISDYDLQNYTASIENTMEYAFNDVLNEVTGKIFVM